MHIVNRQVDLWVILILVSYVMQNHCIKDAEQGLDMENRAYWMTVAMQRWLALRLDFFSNILVLGIALFAAGFRTSVNPAKIGVVLSYALASKFIYNLYFLRSLFFK